MIAKQDPEPRLRVLHFIEVGNMTICQLNEEDIRDFAALYRDYFNAEGDAWSVERAYRRLHQMWSIEDSIGLKAVRKGRICGILLGCLEWFDDGPCFHILEVLVLKEYQGMGIGSALVKEAERAARSMGAAVSTLETLNDPAHERFYGRMGYTTRADLLCKVKKLQRFASWQSSAPKTDLHRG